MKDVVFNVVGYVDRRGPRELEAARAIEQERADQALEREWRRRVAEHPVEHRRLLRGPWMLNPVPALLRRQA